jgi:hypothetical protein
MLESGAAEKQLDILRRELIFVACAYLDACSGRVSVQGEENTGLSGTFFFRSSVKTCPET